MTCKDILNVIRNGEDMHIIMTSMIYPNYLTGRSTLLFPKHIKSRMGRSDSGRMGLMAFLPRDGWLSCQVFLGGIDKLVNNVG